MVSQVLNRVVHSTIGSQLMNLLEQRIDLQSDALQILTYHRVLDPQGFDLQMGYLSANCRVLSMDDMLEVWRNGAELPRDSLIITFDDAYHDFTDVAWPIMKRYGLPATVFVPTDFPDNAENIFWWDRLQYALENTARRDTLKTPAGRFSLSTSTQRQQAYRRIRDYVKKLPYSELLSWIYQICSVLNAPPPSNLVMGWDDLRRLAEEGVTLGAHARTHRFLDQLTSEEIEDEVMGSLQDIKREIGSVLPIFAYPDGRYNDEVIEILEEAGVTMAFTTSRGINEMKKVDWLRLRRINIGPRATLPDLRARLLQVALPPNRWQ